MQRRLKMVDRSDYVVASIATVHGLAGSYAMAIWLALPLWAQTTIQGAITIALGLGAITVQHFWRRYMRQRWPDKEPVDKV